jgi:exodeoxyribonuclease-3
VYDPKGKNKIAGFTPQERESFKEFLHKSRWTDAYRFFNPDKQQYTYFNNRFGHRQTNSGWRVDYFLVSPDFMLKVTDSCIHDKVLGSDHCPIELKINLTAK